MHQISFAPSFPLWQKSARAALGQGLEPGEIHWQELTDDQPALELFPEAEASAPAAAGPVFKVPKEFLPLAKAVALHRKPNRWALLYRVLWRLTHGEGKLLEVVSDADVYAMHEMERAVRRDIHKMRAFVRFREVPAEGGTCYVAWFEPEHHIVEANANFFADRFASMRWSILTPERCVHWDGRALSFTPGVARSEAPTEDAMEDLWRRYYASIFNPARVKTLAMQKEMPKKYWKNLPEATLVPTLLQEAPGRVERMIQQSDMKRVDETDWHPATPPETQSLEELTQAAAGCTACPLYKNATQTVFGEGPRRAQVVLLGEQPGDQEDRAGHPFVGPAGMLLNRAMQDAGLDRDQCYVTNVVKHFKWEPRGKRRLHQTPNARDVAACRPWMEAELSVLQPKMLICLGGTAAKAIFGPGARVLSDRGKFTPTEYAPQTLITVHPSSLLRAPTEEAKEANYALFVADLRLAAEVLAKAG